MTLTVWSACVGRAVCGIGASDMLTDGSEFFLHLPAQSGAHRVIHPATIAEVNGTSMTAVVHNQDVRFDAGEEAYIYFERRRTFMQQPIRIDAVMPRGAQPDGIDAGGANQDSNVPSPESFDGVDELAEGGIVFAFQATADAVSAENRQCYRVSTAVSPAVSASLNEGSPCPVMDVSATGFSVLADTELRQGQVVRAVLDHEQQQCNGTAIVQSVKTLPDGTTRYGLHCAGNENTNGNLLKGLQRISAALQRQQLRRMTGTG